MCRELVADNAPDEFVILEKDGTVMCVHVLEQLPEKYDGSTYPNRREAPS